jgi:geranyl-CoA carboxylase alpha subunit
LQLRLGDAHHAVSVTAEGANDYLIAIGSEWVEVAIVHRDDGVVHFDISGVQQSARFVVQDDALYLDLDGEVFEARDTTLAPAGSNRSAGSLRLLAPMNGVIVNVFAKPDDPVAKGQCVVVLEAMKMQHEIVAERDGTIDKILVKPGDQVATRALVAELKPDGQAAARQQEVAS